MADTASNMYMSIALSLAGKAEGMTSPNPMVGSVVVRGGKMVGCGYHKRCGQAHAEVNALKDAGNRARGATLYVTLEPCDHYGRTGPCTEAIINSGVSKVVIAMKDPNPLNNGRGIKKLKKSGIKVETGLLEAEARSLNAAYIKYITTGMPYVTLKLAQSLDGKIATRTGDSRWITSQASRRCVHKLRAVSDGVMVGVNTVIADDPMLLSVKSNRQPVRIIVDSKLRTPLRARLVKTAERSPVIIAAGDGIRRPVIRKYEDRGVKFIFPGTKRGRVDLNRLMRLLGEDGIANVLVEGGGELAASLIEERLVDRFLFFIAPKIIGGKKALASVGGAGIDRIRDAACLKSVKIKRIAADILVDARA